MGTGFVKVIPIGKQLTQYHTSGMWVTPEKARELVESAIAVYAEDEKKTFKKPKSIQTDINYLRRTQFEKQHKKIRIAWIQDMSKLGGAELSNCMVVNTGEDCGFDIVGITPGNFNLKLLEECNIAIINNCMEFSMNQFNLIREYLFEKRIPFIKYEHDHRELKRQQVSYQFFNLSKLNIFVSPFHKKNHIKAFGESVNDHSICLPVAIDTSKFTNKNYQREKNTIFVPNYYKCRKNIDQYIIQNQNKKFIIGGSAHEVFKTNNVEIIKLIPNEQMADQYNRVDTIYHCPTQIQAGERVLFEAVLCGCKVITNDIVGHHSWRTEFDYTDAKILKPRLDRAVFDFWKAVDKCL